MKKNKSTAKKSPKNKPTVFKSSKPMNKTVKKPVIPKTSILKKPVAATVTPKISKVSSSVSAKEIDKNSDEIKSEEEKQKEIEKAERTEKREAEKAQKKAERETAKAEKAVLKSLAPADALFHRWTAPEFKPVELKQLNLTEIFAIKHLDGQRDVNLTEERYLCFIRTVLSGQSPAAITIARTKDTTEEFLLDGQHRVGTMVKLYRDAPDSIKRWLEANFKIGAEYVAVEDKYTAVQLYKLRNENTRPLASPDKNKVDVYPKLAGFNHMQKELSESTFDRTLKNLLPDNYAEKRDDTKVVENIFSYGIIGKSWNKSSVNKLLRGYPENAAKIVQDAATEVAAVVDGFDENLSGGHKKQLRKILMLGAGALAKARLEGNGKKGARPLKEFIAELVPADIEPAELKDHLAAVLAEKGIGGVGGEGHQRALFPYLKELVQ